MAPLQVIEGKREELEKQLVGCIFTPGPTPKAFEDILASLERRAGLTLVPDPDGTIQAGQ
jgi:hypothetical protein